MSRGASDWRWATTKLETCGAAAGARGPCFHERRGLRGPVLPLPHASLALSFAVAHHVVDTQGVQRHEEGLV
eukprot:3536668-Alexandrium_andersonii.AAC.1